MENHRIVARSIVANYSKARRQLPTDRTRSLRQDFVGIFNPPRWKGKIPV